MLLKYGRSWTLSALERRWRRVIGRHVVHCWFRFVMVTNVMVTYVWAEKTILKRRCIHLYEPGHVVLNLLEYDDTIIMMHDARMWWKSTSRLHHHYNTDNDCNNSHYIFELNFHSYDGLCIYLSLSCTVIRSVWAGIVLRLEKWYIHSSSCRISI